MDPRVTVRRIQRSDMKAPNLNAEKKSRFVVTINTNKSDLKWDSVLEDIYTEMMGDFINSYITYGPGSARKPSDIKKVSAEYAIEQGGRFKKVHMHAMIEVSFIGSERLLLDINNIGELFKLNLWEYPEFGRTEIHRNVRYVKDEISLRDYLLKNPI